MTEINSILRQGVSEAISDDKFARLNETKGLVVKLGIDPSTADLHLGHAVVLRKLREFQELGHRIVLVIGDFTAMIGDPSGRNKLRPILTEKEIRANLRTYLDQAKKVLDVRRVKIVFNSRWLKKLNFSRLMPYAQQLSVNQLLEREDFASRIKNNESLMLHELLYPLAQGIDSLELHADIELGGIDQKFNLLTARELQKKFGQKPQDILMMELLIGTDGKIKMSKSYGNYIALTETADQMFGKIMRIPDELIESYAQLAAWMNDEQTALLSKKTPREAKEEVATRVVALYHGQNEALRVRDSFNKTFKDKQLDPNLKQQIMFNSATVSLLEATQKATALSSSQINRLVSQGGIRINNEVISDSKLTLDLTRPVLLQIGRHRFFELYFK